MRSLSFLFGLSYVFFGSHLTAFLYMWGAPILVVGASAVAFLYVTYLWFSEMVFTPSYK